MRLPREFGLRLLGELRIPAICPQPLGRPSRPSTPAALAALVRMPDGRRRRARAMVADYAAWKEHDAENCGGAA